MTKSLHFRRFPIAQKFFMGSCAMNKSIHFMGYLDSNFLTCQKCSEKPGPDNFPLSLESVRSQPCRLVPGWLLWAHGWVAFSFSSMALLGASRFAGEAFHFVNLHGFCPVNCVSN